MCGLISAWIASRIVLCFFVLQPPLLPHCVQEIANNANAKSDASRRREVHTVSRVKRCSTLCFCKFSASLPRKYQMFEIPLCCVEPVGICVAPPGGGSDLCQHGFFRWKSDIPPADVFPVCCSRNPEHKRRFVSDLSDSVLRSASRPTSLTGIWSITSMRSIPETSASSPSECY